MHYNEAAAIFISRANQRNLIFPYGSDYEGEIFVEDDIPLHMCRDYKIEDLYGPLMQVQEMDPIWVKTCKKKLGKCYPYWDEKFTVVDGNHRVASARKLGRTHIKAIMPESHYLFWRNLDVQSS